MFDTFPRFSSASFRSFWSYSKCTLPHDAQLIASFTPFSCLLISCSQAFKAGRSFTLVFPQLPLTYSILAGADRFISYICLSLPDKIQQGPDSVLTFALDPFWVLTPSLHTGSRLSRAQLKVRGCESPFFVVRAAMSRSVIPYSI